MAKLGNLYRLPKGAGRGRPLLYKYQLLSKANFACVSGTQVGCRLAKR